MKLPWGDMLLAVGGGFLVNWLLGGKGSSMPEPIVRERFVPQPTAVYLERVIWALTRDFDIQRVRSVRNFLNLQYGQVEECYRLQLAPDEVARRVEASLSEGKETFAPTMEPQVQDPMQPSHAANLSQASNPSQALNPAQSTSRALSPSANSTLLSSAAMFELPTT